VAVVRAPVAVVRAPVAVTRVCRLEDL